MLEAFMAPTRGYIRTAHPEASIPPNAQAIAFLLKQGYFGQRKVNGRKIQIHIPHDGGTILCFTRQGTLHTLSIPQDVLEAIRQYYAPREDWNVIEGEFVPKAGTIFLFDFVMAEGIILSHETYKERYSRLKKNFILPFLKILPIYTTLKQCLDDLSKDEPFIEGLVFKVDLPGFSDSTIIRCRKNAA